MARQETNAEKTAARKAAARAFHAEQERKRLEGKLSGKQTFIRVQAEQAFDERAQLPGAHGRKSHPRSSRTPQAIVEQFGKTMAPAQPREWEANIPTFLLAHPPHHLLHAIFDANVLLHAVGQDRVFCCEQAVQLVEDGQVALCLTPAIIDEVSGCAGTSKYLTDYHVPGDDAYALGHLGIQQKDIDKLEALFGIAEQRNFGYFSDEPEVAEDPADVIYIRALRSFSKLHPRVLLVTRDRAHLLSREDPFIVHPKALLGLLQRHDQEK